MATESASTAQQSTELQTIQIEMESKLNEEQKKILSFVYDSAKDFAKEILNKPAVSDAIKMTQLMGSIIKMLETITFNQVKLSGANKKAVALELGHSLIKDSVSDENLKTAILTLYDLTAEQTLETLIDVSKHVNVAQVVSCCEFLAEFFKKK